MPFGTFELLLLIASVLNDEVVVNVGGFNVCVMNCTRFGTVGLLDGIKLALDDRVDLVGSATLLLGVVSSDVLLLPPIGSSFSDGDRFLFGFFVWVSLLKIKKSIKNKLKNKIEKKKTLLPLDYRVESNPNLIVAHRPR